MAKKSRRATPGRTSRRKSSATRGSRSRATFKPAPNPLDALIETTGRALGIKIDPAWLPAIRANLQVTFRLGAMVTALSLADDAEPGPVFRS